MLGRGTRVGIGVLLAASRSQGYSRSDQALGDFRRKSLGGVRAIGRSDTAPVRSPSRVGGGGAVARPARAKSHLVHLAGLGAGRAVHKNSYCCDNDGARLADTSRYRARVQRRHQGHGSQIRCYGIGGAGHMLFRSCSRGSLRRGPRNSPPLSDQPTDSDPHRQTSVSFPSSSEPGLRGDRLSDTPIQEAVRTHQERQVSRRAETCQLRTSQ